MYAPNRRASKCVKQTPIVQKGVREKSMLGCTTCSSIVFDNALGQSKEWELNRGRKSEP